MKQDRAAKLGLQGKEASNQFLQTAQPVVGLNWLGLMNIFLFLPLALNGLCCWAQALSISDLQGRLSCPFGPRDCTGCGWKGMRAPKQVVSSPQSDHAALLLSLQCPAPRPARGRHQEGPAKASTQLLHLSIPLGLG